MVYLQVLTVCDHYCYLDGLHAAKYVFAVDLVVHTKNCYNILFHATFKVFLDEVNTSSCLGLLKEIIVDQTINGMVKQLNYIQSCYVL